MNDKLKRLLQANDWRAAAILCEAEGAFGEAEQLFLKLFDLKSAGRAASQDGRPLEALVHFADGRLYAEVEEVQSHLIEKLSEDIPVAMKILQERGLLSQAATLSVSIGRLIEAADLYRGALDLGAAAQLFERLEDWPEAQKLYKKHLQEHPQDASATLGLGKILQQFGEHSSACDAFQNILSRPDPLHRHALSTDTLAPKEEARERLIFSFIQMGYPHAARSALSHEDLESFLKLFSARTGLDDGATFSKRYPLQPLSSPPLPHTYLARDVFRDCQVLIQLLEGRHQNRQYYVQQLQRLSSPPTLGTLHLIDVDPDLKYLTFKAVEGQLLGDTFAESLPPSRELSNLMKQLLGVLERAHQRGVLHGNINPWSIFIRPGGSLTLVGFGLHGLTSQDETQTSNLEDVPLSYLAPELKYGGKADLRSDFYGVGALFFRLLVKTPPQGSSPWKDPLLPLCWRKPLSSLLSPNPELRPQDHRALRETLRTPSWTFNAESKKKEPSSLSSPPFSQRFTFLRSCSSGLDLMRDEHLQRNVLLYSFKNPITPDEHERLCALSNPKFTALQKVLNLDFKTNKVTLEDVWEIKLLDCLKGLGTLEKVNIFNALNDDMKCLHQTQWALGGFDLQEDLRYNPMSQCVQLSLVHALSLVRTLSCSAQEALTPTMKDLEALDHLRTVLL